MDQQQNSHRKKEPRKSGRDKKCVLPKADWTISIKQKAEKI